MFGHGKIHLTPSCVASWDTTAAAAVAERRGDLAAIMVETEECRTVIRNTCW